MIKAVKQKSIVGEKGRIEIQAEELPEGTEVEVIVFADSLFPSSNLILEDNGLNKPILIMLERLYKLKKEYEDLDEDECEEVFYPTDYAFSSSVNLLIELYRKLGDSLPLGFCSVDSRGGINLIWKNKALDKEVRVNLPFSQEIKNSVYYRQEDNSILIEDFYFEIIYRLLSWLITDQLINSL